MDNPFLKELSALLQESEKLLACPEPETQLWEGYGRIRQEAFARLQAAGPLAADGEGERAVLAKLIRTVLEGDQLLMQRLDEGLSGCRKGLSAVAKARQALRGYLPPRPSSFLQRHA